MRHSTSICIAGLLWLAAGAAPGQEPVGIVNHLPRDPVLAGVVEIGNPDEGLGKLMEFVTRFDPELDPTAWEAEMAELDQEIGCSLRGDLLAQVGPELAFAFDLPPIDQLMAGMEDPAAAVVEASRGTGLVVGVRDGAALAACLSRLAGHFELTVAEEEGIVRIAPPEQAGAELPADLAVYYSVGDGFAALSASPEFVASALAPRAAGGRLIDGEDFRRVFSHLEASAKGLSYLNLPKIRGLLEGSEFLQGMLASNQEARPILELIRSPDFTGMGVGATSVEIDGGVRRMTYGPRALAGGAASAGIVAAVVIPNFIDALEKAKRQRTMADLRNLAVALEAYAVDSGAYPETGGEWLPAESLTDALGSLYLAEVPATDGWGHPLVYWSDGVSYRIASPGKDGQMQHDWLAVATVDGAPPPPPETDLVFGDGSFQVPVEE
ncbi:MAG: type II secretion system protein GspG [Thermoanaerobaculia bacterium]|nr:type II secretion system protein GspG [Thermoanaerobaculia bacterium]